MSAYGCSSSARLVGSIPTVTFLFTDTDGVATDPTSLDIRVYLPDLSTDDYTEASPEVDNPAVGTWTWRPLTAPPLAGTYWVYGTGSGALVDVSAEATFTLGDTHVPLGP